MGASNETDGKDLVILIHGIRTRAYWQGVVRSELEKRGFEVELTNYGRFDLLRFLLPIWAFRLAAIARVQAQISDAIRRHPGKRVSFIAHSFGTFVLGHLLRYSLWLHVHRVIFCGSILAYDFPFGTIVDGVEFINEVGGQDFLPALAERVTWGYGSTGTYGFRRPGVYDRFHTELGHSDFLTGEFCIKYWVPLLKDGTRTPADPSLTKKSVAPLILGVIANKYLIIGAISILLLWDQAIRAKPIPIDIDNAGGYAFVGMEVGYLIHDVEVDRCPDSSIWDFLRERRCVSMGETDSTQDIVTCRIPPEGIHLTGRDPIDALQKVAEHVPCLRVATDQRQVSIKVDRAQTMRWNDGKGRTYEFCGCAEDVVDSFRKKYGSEK